MSTTARPPVALTVAGFDPCAGAGLQADLKTFAAHRVYGATVVTAVTVQDTVAVHDVLPMPAEVVAAQLRAVLDDLPVAAIKTGMLGNGEVVNAVADLLGKRTDLPLVVDPVLVSSSGAPLLDAAGRAAMVRCLLPLARLITPNRDEAAILSGLPDAPLSEQVRCLAEGGPGAILITGGDGHDAEVVDLFHDGSSLRELRHERIETTATHGTGCTLSAAVVARLASGAPLVEAVTGARRWVQEALRAGHVLGRGHGPLHHFHEMWGDT